jgi:nucleoside-diphosphate-sugar epimerase
MNIVLTGASGYVASKLIKGLSNFNLTTIDRVPSAATAHVFDLNDSKRLVALLESIDGPFTVVHLAAARTDFNCTALEYHRDNVAASENLLKALEKKLPVAFIHMSSVAALDGAVLKFRDTLDPDDAYRCTKYIQEEIINNWTTEMKIPFWCLAPSAIFDASRRGDTNIGKLQKIARLLKFVPNIKSKKSLTYLNNLCAFLEGCLNGRVTSGKYLTVEQPILTVSETLQVLTGGAQIRTIPLLRSTLFFISYLLYPLRWIPNIDPILTPNRVVKLFRNTDYPNPVGYETDAYVAYCSSDLRKILTEYPDR